MSESWIILGASSSMARAFARDLAARGASLALCGRDTSDLEHDAADARLRGAGRADVIAFDTRDATSFDQIADWARSADGTLGVAVFAGSMPGQDEIDGNPALIHGVVTDNFTGSAELLLRLAPMFEDRGAGWVVGVGSVAGDRGRLGNYTYGAAKSGFHTFLSGLRNRLGRSGVHVMTVKPGFVDTAMTWGIDGMFLVARPDQVSAAILSGLERRRNVLYVPVFWLGIMGVIRTIPEFVFKKLKI